MAVDLRLRNFSPATQRNYLLYARRFVALRQALDDRTSAESTRRVQSLLNRLGPEAAERLREAQAIGLSEYIGTPETQELLMNLAGGETKARPTREAKAPLDRLEKRTAE
jgi:hypothetical protein